LIGTPFKGMGDFFVTPEELEETIGSTVVPFDMNKVVELRKSIPDDEVEREIADDLRRFNLLKYNEETHSKTARMDLLVRKWIELNHLDAYSMNFSDFDRKLGFECVPFIEACKSMARGIGYAGEGDVLTASLCGALLKIYPETSFTEMFCPDWQGNSIFLSHMGEMNEKTVKGKMNLTEKDYPYSDVDAPMMVNGCFMPGEAVLVNLAPMENGQYTLILSKVSVLDVDEENGMKDSIHGWFQPEIPISDFLEKYSIAGGTHHVVMVYGSVLSGLTTFGKMMGFTVEII
jgi:L-arabinose isomerase